MSGAITGLDHLLIGVSDLEKARAAYERLGFRATPRGRHIGWGTANYCLMFPHDYVELLGIVDASQFTNNLDVFLAEHGEGLLGTAFAGNDLDAAAERLHALGYDSDGPKDLKRTLELPEGDALPRFRLLHLPAEATPGLRAFICRHLTPDMVWQKPWLDHPNGACRVAALTVVVENPEGAAAAYGRLLGAEPIYHGAGLAEVGCGDCRLRFTKAEGVRALHPQSVDVTTSASAGPVAMDVAVGELAQTARHLEDAGAAYRRGVDGRLHVVAKEACGVLLDFV